MKVPNWQHHSKKEKKRHLKPQALRQAKARRRQLINVYLTLPNEGFFLIMESYKRGFDVHPTRN